ncbi:MAG: glycogen synthase GlgA [Clostridium sp.]
MRVLLVGSEAHPFIKSGGLGDVLGALPKSLSKKGVDVRVVIPKYKHIKEELKSKIKFVKWFTVKVGWRNQYCGIFEYCENDVTYYLIDNEYYFNRDGQYGYYDDGERFAFYDRAVLEMIREINWKPDVIHCNDWHTGMIPVLLKLEYVNQYFYKGIKTVFSIHNMLFQGVFDKNILPELFGYDMEPFNNGSLEFYDGVSFMKGGIVYSDKISTVSYTYANEIRTPQYGERLEGLFIERGYALRGILNGIDYEEFNPHDDVYIYNNFTNDVIKSKKENKLKLQKELGLHVDENIPMIGIVSRLTNQKGLDLIVNIADRLLQANIQLVILGTGDHYYEEHFRGLEYRYKEKVSSIIKFDNTLAHKIYASSDMFLMPSLFEPCGLGQLIALRYGSVPIVRETGGLKDTICPYNQYNGVGNGFSFRNYNANELLHTIEYALEIYKDKERWDSIVSQAMNSNNSWDKSANEYRDLYQELIEV